MLRDELSFLIKRISLIRSSAVELDDEVHNMVKSFGETGCPVSQWCEGMLVGGGLTRFLSSAYIYIYLSFWHNLYHIKKDEDLISTTFGVNIVANIMQQSMKLTIDVQGLQVATHLPSSLTCVIRP